MEVGRYLATRARENCHVLAVGGGSCTRPLGGGMAEWPATDLRALLLVLFVLNYYY